jgi:hypothetical protein
LPSAQLSYLDNTVDSSKLYHYSLQAITETGDTSISQIALFAPRAARAPLPPDITNASATASGFSVHFTVPSKNEAGGAAKGLSDIIFLIDDTLVHNFSITDADQGKDFEKPFFSLAIGYHKFQCFAVTKVESGDTTRSALTPPVWLYAGAAFTEYSETFQDSKNIFTPYAWDTTSYNGRLSSRFMNDSIAGVPYQSNVNSWFVLPPVTISDLTHTLEFGHIALVATGDSALVEISTNDGLTFSELRFYDKSHELTKWTDSVVTSTPMSEAISLKPQLGKDVIIRFRLTTKSSGGDGWFINNVKFSDLLGVSNETAQRNDLHLYPIPVRSGSKLSLEFSALGQGKTSITVYDMLGKKRISLMENRSLNAGEYSFDFYPSESGVFYLMLETMNSKGIEKRVGRFIVLP